MVLLVSPSGIRYETEYPVIGSTTWCGVETVTSFPPINSISIPMNMCFSPVVQDSFSKFTSILSEIIELKLSSMCEIMLSSANDPMVHWSSLINLFVMHCSYGLFLNPRYYSVVENKSYHRRALSIITYNAFNIRTYSTFFPSHTSRIFLTPDLPRT